jgi:ATPase subunit of ABC transporter with duplicated ATPase domains
MSLLEVNGLKFRHSQEELYNEVSLRLFDKEHLVLVGPNGAGKSTLLKLLSRDLKPDSGTIQWVNKVKVGYLDQYASLANDLLVKDYLYDVYTPLFEKEAQVNRLYESLVNINETDYDRVLNQAQRLTDELEADNFYQIQSQISNVLNGLGLGTDVLALKIKQLSGGMRAKLILASLLLKDSDVLLLDEPTNFLDVMHVEWLAKFLNNYPKTFIVISHDEGFLRNIAKTVIALENKQLNRYKGDYEFYLKERVVRFDQHQKDFSAQQRLISKTKDFIDKNITRASTTKRAQSRRKMLEKLTVIERPVIKKRLHFKFLLGKTTGLEVLKVKDLEIGYDDPLVEPISFVVKKGEKVVITGKNGVGKSTLLKTILGYQQKLSGQYSFIDTAQIVYFAQDSIENNQYTPFEIIQSDSPNLTNKQVYSVLANFGISFEMATRSLKSLSGGEQTKVRFALIRNHKSNVLILDEPTNHLDFDAKESLKQALIDYQGTLIFVSHEKEFYQEVCDYEINLE